MKSLMVMGRQPALGLAELESLYGAGKVRAAGSQAAVVDVDPCLLAFERLGGSVKFCKVLTEVNSTNWDEVEKFLINVSPAQSEKMPEGKMTLGLSLYDFTISPKRIEATGLNLKKAIRQTGRSVRLVPNKTAELSSAQVAHNKLTSERAWELVFVNDGTKTIIAQTAKVQNIESYTLRDRGRPKRDTRVGMLPPKLAQIIINLAVGKLPEDKLESICEIPAGQPVPRKYYEQTILDPFCGTGVILQEAALMGYYTAGSDISERMIEYSWDNLTWFAHEYGIDMKPTPLDEADATTASWNGDLEGRAIDFVASETYLGRPFTTNPSDEILKQTVSECNVIIRKFLQNIHGQLQPGARLCLAVPAWRLEAEHLPLGDRSQKPKHPTPNAQFRHLPLIDQLSDLGYNRLSFEHVRNDQLLYYREDQIVARELLVLERI